MRTRENILSEVLSIYREIEEKQKNINSLYEQAKKIDDPDDIWRNSYLECIKSYAE